MPDYKRKKQTAAGLHLGKKGNIIKAVCKSAGAGGAFLPPSSQQTPIKNGGFSVLLELFLDTLTDAAKMLPFLFLACLLVELAEHRRGERLQRLLSGESRVGFLVGALLGALPQCGFSAMAANLYAGRVITLGTLLSVFLATSDEAFLVLLANPSAIGALAALVAFKILLGAASGFAIDFLLRRRLIRVGMVAEQEQIHCPCEHDEGAEHPVLAALRHTLEVTAYVVLFSFLIHLVMEQHGGAVLTDWLAAARLLQPVLAAAIGLIPNCAASVLLAQLYLSGVISFASLAAGLASAAGIGLLVLFRENRPFSKNLAITGILFVISASAGIGLTVLEQIF